MSKLSISVEPRKILGKKVKKLRREGILPVNLFGKDLNEYSLETVKMFYKDALESGYSIKQPVKL